jgi:hypothetical protein
VVGDEMDREEHLFTMVEDWNHALCVGMVFGTEILALGEQLQFWG